MKTRYDAPTAETPEQLIEHISRLMGEAEAMLAGPVPAQSPASSRLSDIRYRIDDARMRLHGAYTRARNGVVAGARYTDGAIREYPYQSMAVALGAGVLLGWLIGRGVSTRRAGYELQ